MVLTFAALMVRGSLGQYLGMLPLMIMAGYTGVQLVLGN